MKTKAFSVDLPRIDGNTQSRLAINEDVVGDYADLIAASNGEWPFPPIDVFHDVTDYFVADGFHRFLAARRSKRGSIPCRIHKGTAKDARIFGMTANDRHGLRMSQADKRACVGWLLDNGGKMTQKALAESAGVSARMVSTIIADRKYEAMPAKPAQSQRGGDSQIANQAPVGGVDDDAPKPSISDSSDDDEIPFDAPETPEEPPKAKGQPGKQYDRSYWLKQYDQAIGPPTRLVDKIAGGVGETDCESHKLVQDHLNSATEEIHKWLEQQPSTC